MNSVSVSKKFVVVGDKFNEFSNGRNVVTISQLELITQAPANIIETNTKFIAGQGVRDDYVGKILGNMHRNKYHDNKIDLTDLQQLTTTERNCHSHKKEKYNTLIGTAERVNENLFALPLLIDERCELMGDHQTGKHVQGMVLVEACRQTFIAITEEAYQRHKLRGDLTVFISGSMLPLLKPLGKQLNVDAILCTKLLLDEQGKLTGEIGDPQTIGEGKKRAMQTFSQQMHIDLRKSFAYGDDISDIPMLAATGHPICAGDYAILANYARQNKWKIIGEGIHINGEIS